MEKSSKRGKIPQQDWPSIITRYEAGETLASIARTYDCSPPAISYIVSRTRARNAAAEAVAPKASLPVPAEPQLIKVSASPTPVNGMPADDQAHDRAVAGEIEQLPRASQQAERGLFPDEPLPAGAGEPQRPPEVYREPQHDGPGQREFHAGGNGTALAREAGPSGGAQQFGEARRRLHLSLPQSNGNGGGAEAHPPGMPNSANPGFGQDSRPVGRPQGGQPGFAPQPRQVTAQPLPFGPSPSPLGAMRVPAATLGEAHRPREAGAFIDHALRERIDGDIAAFLAAFDAALDNDTVESRTGLREATDRLLRAGARTRIELERLEARVPLASRDKNSQPSSLFRPR
jgi:transposase-like protein